MQRIVTAGMILAVSSIASAETTSSPLSFEVASIKAAAPPADGRLMVSMGGDPGRVNYTNVSLINVIANAFQVKEHQVSGTSRLSSERFDITAKLPEGASRSQVPEM